MTEYWVFLQASNGSSHTEELRYNETVCLWMTTFYAPPRGMSTLAKEFTATNRIMVSSTNELSTLVYG